MRAEVALPPNTRHLAVRTGKRYGKTSLTARHGRDLARAIAECRYLRRERGSGWHPGGRWTRGLDHAQRLRTCQPRALGIPAHRTGHCWGMRGSNSLEDCDVFLVVGTPAVRPEKVERLACAYYHADPQVVDEASVRGEDGVFHYRDPRIQRVANALARAELTQWAHRNRPLHYDGRLVVTLCADEVLYLPVTTEITSLPQLTRGAIAIGTRASGRGGCADGQSRCGSGETR